MRRLGEILMLLFAVGAQVTLWPQLTARVLPALVLVIVLLWGYADGVTAGFRTAAVGGLILDLYHQQRFGLFTTALVIAYAVTLVLRAPGDESTLAERLSGIVLAAAAYELVVLVWIKATTGHFPFFEELLHVATLNVAATIVVFALCQPLLAIIKPPYSPHHARSL